MDGPRLGTYLGRSPDFSCPGDHATWEIVLLADGVCTLSCTSELSLSKGGSQAWIVEAVWEWCHEDDEVSVSVTKEALLGGPKCDRDITIPLEDGALSFKGALCTWSKPPRDPVAEELAAMSLKELKAAALAAGLDPSGCVEREDFLRLLERARASGTWPPPASAPPAASAPASAPPAPATPTLAAAQAPATKEAPAAPAPSPSPAPELPSATVSAAAETGASADAPGTYSLEQLADKRSWEKLDVKPGDREIYLPDNVFVELFGMPKADFAKLPKWKKDNAKKKHNLF